MAYFLNWVNNCLSRIAALTVSAGSADADKLAATSSNGKLDNSLINWDSPSAIGGTTANTVKGTTLTATSSTASTSTTTGALTVGGGAGVAGDIYGGGSLNLPGLVVGPTGAIQTVGVGGGSVSGNARGTGAIDLQTGRSSAGRVASGSSSVVIGGFDNAASKTYSTTVGGNNNTASGLYSTTVGGNNNTASGSYSATAGGQYALADKESQIAQAAGQFAAAGDAQTSTLVARCTTTSATQANAYLNGSSTRLTIATNTAWRYRIDVIAKQVGSTNHAAFTIEGTIVKGTTVASTALGVTASSKSSFANGLTWDFNVSVDTSFGALNLLCTGAAATTIQWVCSIRLVETTG